MFCSHERLKGDLTCGLQADFLLLMDTALMIDGSFCQAGQEIASKQDKNWSLCIRGLYLEAQAWWKAARPL